MFVRPAAGLAGYLDSDAPSTAVIAGRALRANASCVVPDEDSDQRRRTDRRSGKQTGASHRRREPSPSRDALNVEVTAAIRAGVEAAVEESRARP